MSLIRVRGLTFGYEGSYDMVFEDVSFQIDTDWKLGCIGRNGRGKTTFLKLLAGEYAYRGEISASAAFTYFPFAVQDRESSARAVAAALCPGCETWVLQRELGLLKTDAEMLARPFGTLSHGEQTKLMLAALFLKENNFLLIDEPTNHLDIRGRAVVSAYLNKKKGFILVSHDRAFLDGCIDHVLSINKADIEVQEGNFSTWWQNRQYKDAFELAENKRLQRDMKRLSKAARQSAGWSDALEKTKKNTRNSGLRPDRGYIGHKSAKMMRRAKSIEARRQKAAEEKAGLLKNIETAEPLKLQTLRHHSKVLAEAADLSVRYGQKAVFEGVRFRIAQGERIALQGKNGAGKSSLLRLILGENIAHTGRLWVASGVRISYVSQDTAPLQGGLSALARANGWEESLFKAILRKFGFPRVQFEKDLRDFSEGQKKKVLIAGSLCEPAHLYLWDEPLNFIDVLSRMQIERLLLEARPTMLFVEHDRAFVDAVATGRIGL